MREPHLAAEERHAVEKAAAEFNAGLFFECHDTLEEMWSGHRGPAREFFQGLIQVAVGFYHLGNGNRSGADSMFSRALRRLEGYPDRYCGFDVAAHRRAVEEWRERARTAPVEELTAACRPVWRFDLPPPAAAPPAG